MWVIKTAHDMFSSSFLFKFTPSAFLFYNLRFILCIIYQGTCIWIYMCLDIWAAPLYSFQISIFSQMPNIEVLTLRLVCVTCRCLVQCTHSPLLTLTVTHHMWWSIYPGCLSVASTTYHLSPLLLAACLCVSSTWEGTLFPHSLSCHICVHWPVSGFSGWLRTPVVELTLINIASLSSAAYLASRSWTTKVNMQCFIVNSFKVMYTQKKINHCVAFKQNFVKLWVNTFDKFLWWDRGSHNAP